jgi:hypothetical protein
MPSLSKKEAREFLETVERISDDRVIYFYMMLGNALADARSRPHPPLETPAGTGTQHSWEIAKPVNA